MPFLLVRSFLASRLFVFCREYAIQQQHKHMDSKIPMTTPTIADHTSTKRQKSISA